MNFYLILKWISLIKFSKGVYFLEKIKCEIASELQIKLTNFRLFIQNGLNAFANKQMVQTQFLNINIPSVVFLPLSRQFFHIVADFVLITETDCKSSYLLKFVFDSNPVLINAHRSFNSFNKYVDKCILLSFYEHYLYYSTTISHIFRFSL